MMKTQLMLMQEQRHLNRSVSKVKVIILTLRQTSKHVSICVLQAQAETHQIEKIHQITMSSPVLTIGLKKKSTLDCVTKILSKLFSNQQGDVLETFET